VIVRQAVACEGPPKGGPGPLWGPEARTDRSDGQVWITHPDPRLQGTYRQAPAPIRGRFADDLCDQGPSGLTRAQMRQDGMRRPLRGGAARQANRWDAMRRAQGVWGLKALAGLASDTRRYQRRYRPVKPRPTPRASKARARADRKARTHATKRTTGPAFTVLDRDDGMGQALKLRQMWGGRR